MVIRPMLGEFALPGIERIEHAERRVLVEHHVPGMTGSYFQDLGTEPNHIVVEGSAADDEGRDQLLEGLRGMFEAAEPVTFVADINTATDLADVLIEDLWAEERAGSADRFRYVLTLRRWVAPPEPESGVDLDTGILEDAQSALDTLETLDALEGLGAVADPSQPLSDAVDGVASSTASVGPASESLRAVLGDGGAGGALDAVPEAGALTSRLAPLTGSENGGGVAAAARALAQVRPAEQGNALAERFDAAMGTGPTTAPGGTASASRDSLQVVERAVAAVPREPDALTGALRAPLERLTTTLRDELSAELGRGFDALGGVRGAVPRDGTALAAPMASALGRLRTEFGTGRIAELGEWSSAVDAIATRIAAAVGDGTGAATDALVALVGELLATVARAAIGADGPRASTAGANVAGALTDAHVDAIRAALAAYVVAADRAVASGPGGLTAALDEARSRFDALVRLLVDAADALGGALAQPASSPAGLGADLDTTLARIERLRIVDVGDLGTVLQDAVRPIADAVASLGLERVRETLQQAFARLDTMLDAVDPSRLTGRTGEVATRLRGILDELRGAVASVAAEAAEALRAVRDALREAAGALGSWDAAGVFHFHLETELRQYLQQARDAVHDTIAPAVTELRETVRGALDAAADALAQVQGEIDGVRAQLEGALRQATDALRQADVPGRLVELEQTLREALTALDAVDFDLVVDPIVEALGEAATKLRRIDTSQLNAVLKGTITVSVQVVVVLEPIFVTQVKQPLMAKIDELLETPRGALREVEARAEAALQRVGELDPTVLLKPLEDLYAPVRTAMAELHPQQLAAPLLAWHARAMTELAHATPGALLAPLIEAHQRLRALVTGVGPAGLAAAIDRAIQDAAAEIRALDVGALMGDVGTLVSDAREAIDGIAPDRLLAPVTDGYARVLRQLEAFDPVTLVRPLERALDPLLAPITQLTDAQLATLGVAVAPLAGITDDLDPTRADAALRVRLGETRARIGRLDLGALVGTLQEQADRLRVKVQAPGAEASLSVQVDAVRPLAHAGLTAAVSGLRAADTTLGASLALPGPDDAARARYTTVRPQIELLVPAWARTTPTRASLLAAVDAVRPAALLRGVSTEYQRMLDQVRALDPSLLVTEATALRDRASAAIGALDPAALAATVQGIVADAVDRLGTLDVGMVTRELAGIGAEIDALVGALDPSPVIAQLDAIAGEVRDALSAFDPAGLLADVEAPLGRARAIVGAFDPATLRAPLEEAHGALVATLSEVDVGAALRPLDERLTILRDNLEEGIDRTGAALVGLVAAVPT